jgi:hypothetical protein
MPATDPTTEPTPAPGDAEPDDPSPAGEPDDRLELADVESDELPPGGEPDDQPAPAEAEADADADQADGDAERETPAPEEAPGATSPAVAGTEAGAPVRAMLGVALVLVAGRFVAAGDPTRPAWLAGYAAAGAATGLVLAAAVATVAAGVRLWWRALAVAGALAVQAGLILGWSEPMDVTRAGPSVPVVLVAAGALVVALALWLAPAGDRDAAWPGAAAVGAAVGYGATLVGGARLVAFDIAEHVSPGAEVDGWLADLVPLVVVAALATPLALGAIAAAHGSPDPGRVTAVLVGLGVVPVAAAGDGWTAIALAATAVGAGAAASRWGRDGGGAGVVVAAVVLGGTALAAAASAGPTGVLGAALYGAVLGTLADVIATRAVDGSEGRGGEPAT